MGSFFVFFNHRAETKKINMFEFEYCGTLEVDTD